MRHERALDKDKYSKVEAPTMWAAGAQLAPMPVIEIEESEPSPPWRWELPRRSTCSESPRRTGAPSPAAAAHHSRAQAIGIDALSRDPVDSSIALPRVRR